VDAFKSWPSPSFSTSVKLKFPLVNVILVVGHEKLNVEMQRTYGTSLKIVKIPKSGGVSRYLANLVPYHENLLVFVGCGTRSCLSGTGT
jgi:hypothetical protein